MMLMGDSCTHEMNDTRKADVYKTRLANLMVWTFQWIVH